jgi:hypothetical protein
LVSQSKFSSRIELYDELSRCLQQDDKDRAIKLIDQLLSSGTSADRILGHLRPSISGYEGEAAKPGLAARRSVEIGETAGPSARSGSVDNPGGTYQAQQAIPSTVDRLSELSHPMMREPRQDLLGKGQSGPAAAKNIETALLLQHNASLGQPGGSEPKLSLAGRKPQLLALSLATVLVAAWATGTFLLDHAPVNANLLAEQRVLSSATIQPAEFSPSIIKPVRAAGMTDFVHHDGPVTAAAATTPDTDANTAAPPLAVERSPGPAESNSGDNVVNRQPAQPLGQLPNLQTEKQQMAPPDAATLIARGDAFLAAGDITSARLFYQHAADAGDGAAALRLGATFDPAFLGRAESRGGGDRTMALRWYEHARALGNSNAELFLSNPDPSKEMPPPSDFLAAGGQSLGPRDDPDPGRAAPAQATAIESATTAAPSQQASRSTSKRGIGAHPSTARRLNAEQLRQLTRQSR